MTLDDRGADGGGGGGNKQAEGGRADRANSSDGDRGADWGGHGRRHVRADGGGSRRGAIDDIGEGTDLPTGGLIKEPSRDGLGMDLFGLVTDDGGELDELGVLMGNGGGAADHPAVHRPIVDSPKRLCRCGTPQKNPTGRTNESSRARQMKGLKRK